MLDKESGKFSSSSRQIFGKKLTMVMLLAILDFSILTVFSGPLGAPDYKALYQ